MVIQQLQMRAVGAGVTVDDQEVNAFMKAHAGSMNAYHLFDILVPLPDKPTTAQVDAAQKQASNLLQQLRSGGNLQKITANLNLVMI